MYSCDVWCLIYMLLAFLIFALKCYVTTVLCVIFIHLIGRRAALYFLLGGLAVFYWWQAAINKI
ncbi:hypothetical protein ASFV_Kyiv_2016_131_00245 [African swine fever virus]|uniref:Uncharacterized protein n=1 Tax=African swine fever virus TaxID=10497 RepID=A0A5B8XAF8_ASF|nr:hypothetical protein ASFV_Kyiv_2016_131_00002 [African swine fever virus]QED21781.1 hypothetical protein ASFV_Kyiv_2016_131_00245 [African swine fever virus]UNZ12085.1 hypothetical protein [African swine fever virus]UNZ12300.1 hypothetical protein [African swine fever virus]UNZ12304.1 hypothetical protein [African swine fever virus]